MEPRIQYAHTKDGVSIAFASMGEGPPLVRMPLPAAAHAQREWAMFPNIFPPLTRTFRLILYDSRGTGLSDRDAIDFSMGAMTRDLEAVIDRTGLQSFAVLAINDAVPIAVTYAATFPDRVSHLILIDGWTKSSDYSGMPAFEAHEALIDRDWTLYTETMARVLAGFDDPRFIELLGEHIRACIEPEAYRALAAAIKSYDVSALLAGVRAETLVLHNNNNRFIPVRAGQKLAAGIPDARFLAIDDMNYERVAPLVEEFAGTAGKPRSVEPGAFRTILFTDVEGSTALTQRLGDAKARELLRQHERIVREALKSPGGAGGDGFMASFSSATRALQSAIAMQRAFAAHNQSAQEPILVRVGLNAGEPIAEEDDLYGTAVNLPARICGHAEAGQILASNVVQELAAGKGFVFTDQGEASLKGFDKPVRLFEVRWQDA